MIRPIAPPADVNWTEWWLARDAEIRADERAQVLAAIGAECVWQLSAGSWTAKIGPQALAQVLRRLKGGK